MESTSIFSLILTGLILASCGAELPPEVDQAYAQLPDQLNFNFDVRPILSDRCFACHGPDENAREADLRLDEEQYAFAAMANGKQSFIRNDPEASEAIKRILHEDPEMLMPPPDSKLVLTSREKAILIKWVEDGAEWKEHWAYTTPIKANIEAADKSPIDHFIDEKLISTGLKRSPEASKETLIRRLSLDLTGLPPTLLEIDAFLSDRSPNAYETLVERLLSSSDFGERWAWEWMDISRYSDTNGFQGDPTRKMWPWRDWVINAINNNMPYDQFTVEQLAGDLLPNATNDQILATAFNRNHMYNGEGGRIPEETRVENVYDRTETMGTVWLGLTLNCCRCHDHKYDNLSQKEYYQFYDYFNQTSEGGMGRNGRVPPVLDLSGELAKADVAEIAAMLEQAAKEVEDYERIIFPRESGPASESSAADSLNGDDAYSLSLPPKKRGSYYTRLLMTSFQEANPEYADLLENLRNTSGEYDKQTADNLQVMVMDQLEVPRATFVLSKGSYDQPLEQVKANIPEAIPALGHEQVDDRLSLARWLVDDKHPLTARVTVNRLWQSIFGTGLVKTIEDFGVQSEKPSHPQLLDWLAVDFVESGWDVKKLLKLMVMSQTYRQTSIINPAAAEIDAENRLFTYAPRYRIASWKIRDQALKLSGLLVNEIGGPSVKPYQPPGIWEEATFGFTKYVQNHGDSLYRKSLYTFWRRIVGPTMFFDNSARQTCSVRKSLTNTPMHALVTLNDVTFSEAARVWAENLIVANNSISESIQQGFRMATGRKIKSEEMEILTSRYEKLKTKYSDFPAEAKKIIRMGEYPVNNSLPIAQLAAMSGVCSIFLNMDETLTRQ